MERLELSQAASILKNNTELRVCGKS